MNIKRMVLTLGLLLAVHAGVSATPATQSPSLGESTLAPLGEDHPVRVYHASTAPEQPVLRGRVVLNLAVEGPPSSGNGRLVVISHGSGGAAWVHEQLARRLVEAGFVVAFPQHRGDSAGDDATPGPESWVRRPAEVSRAIDAVARDPRFASHLRLDRVGVYGFSAGGLTALTMAGGRWSPAAFRDHCDTHLAEDFQTCVGLITRLTGGPLDGLKQWLVRRVMHMQFDDPLPKSHHDPRVAAVVAAGPHAAAFDMTSFAAPRAPLALVTLAQDRWLVPRFHSDRVLAACSPCEHLADIQGAGHGAMLAPLPPGLTGLAGDMLNDPPGFDRAQLVEVDRKIAAYFLRHLVDATTQAATVVRPLANIEGR